MIEGLESIAHSLHQRPDLGQLVLIQLSLSCIILSICFGGRWCAASRWWPRNQKRTTPAHSNSPKVLQNLKKASRLPLCHRRPLLHPHLVCVLVLLRMLVRVLAQNGGNIAREEQLKELQPIVLVARVHKGARGRGGTKQQLASVCLPDLTSSVWGKHHNLSMVSFKAYYKLFGQELLIIVLKKKKKKKIWTSLF